MRLSLVLAGYFITFGGAPTWLVNIAKLRRRPHPSSCGFCGAFWGMRLGGLLLLGGVPGLRCCLRAAKRGFLCRVPFEHARDGWFPEKERNQQNTRFMTQVQPPKPKRNRKHSQTTAGELFKTSKSQTRPGDVVQARTGALFCLLGVGHCLVG